MTGTRRRTDARGPKLIIALCAIGTLVAVSIAAGGAHGDERGTAAPPTRPTASTTAAYSKVLVIVEENETYSQIIGHERAPYVTELASTYGQASAMDAGYPEKCPSLAAYMILTSGNDHGICDDKGPDKHPVTGPNVFAQVSAAGKQWRLYGEDMPGNCAQENAGRFVVRHAPSNYYVDLRLECLLRSVPMGDMRSGAFRDDVDAGTLPELGFLIPNLCNDMHGAKGCRDAVPHGDDWLRDVLPTVLAGPDYRAGRLAVVIAWDEGTEKNNHIPFVLVSPSTSGVNVERQTSLCSVLATISDVLAVDPLGCAAQVPSLAADFGIARSAGNPT